MFCNEIMLATCVTSSHKLSQAVTNCNKQPLIVGKLPMRRQQGAKRLCGFGRTSFQKPTATKSTEPSDNTVLSTHVSSQLLSQSQGRSTEPSSNVFSSNRLLLPPRHLPPLPLPASHPLPSGHPGREPAKQTRIPCQERSVAVSPSLPSSHKALQLAHRRVGSRSRGRAAANKSSSYWVGCPPVLGLVARQVLGWSPAKFMFVLEFWALPSLARTLSGHVLGLLSGGACLLRRFLGRSPVGWCPPPPPVLGSVAPPCPRRAEALLFSSPRRSQRRDSSRFQAPVRK